MMGFFAFFAGITRDLYWAARQWLGHLPGGLAIATVFGSAGFAAACGASTASAAVMGKIALPELKKFGHDDKVATGAVAGMLQNGMGMAPRPCQIKLPCLE